MKRIVAAIIVSLGIFCTLGFGFAQRPQGPLTIEEKDWGLMTVWGEVKYNFVFADRLKDWDEKARQLLPEIAAAGDVGSYYNILKKLVASLGNGHTVVHGPNAYWDYFNMPPLEIKVIDKRFFITRVGLKAEIIRQNVRPGLEITSVDGEPALRHFHEKILPLCSYSALPFAYSRFSMWLLAGPKEKPARVVVADERGNRREVLLERGTKQDDGTYFLRRQEDPFHHNLESKVIEGVLYINLATFGIEKAALLSQFEKILGGFDLKKLKGIILDVRDNGGGNDEAAFGIAERFLTKPALGAKSRLRKYIAAHKAWGYPDEWEELEPQAIQPAIASKQRYEGPLVLLVGPETASSAEDFVLLLKNSGRAILVGESTAGDTGQILSFNLPQGGFLWVLTKWDLFPDGEDLIGVGIKPDYEIQPTIKDILAGRDPVLEKAVNIISKPDGLLLQECASSSIVIFSTAQHSGRLSWSIAKKSL